MIKGSILIGSRDEAGTSFFTAIDPATGGQIAPDFASAGSSVEGSAVGVSA